MKNRAGQKIRLTSVEEMLGVTNVTAYNNLSLINKLCLHLIQLMKLRDTKTSVNRIRKKFGWNFEDSMENLLSFFHEEAIIQALTAEKVSSLILSDK